MVADEDRCLLHGRWRGVGVHGRLLDFDLQCLANPREVGAAVARSGATIRLLLLYTQSLLTQMTQTAACNRHHTLDQQFSRWLLLSFDRLCGDEMVMTQKLIAKMLGVTSDAVTGTAMALGATGAIAYRDGRITLLDRALLEKASCECYEVVRRECRRLLPPAARQTD